MEVLMPALTITAKGQVTFRKEILQHLGLKPGEKIELDLIPGGKCIIQAVKPTGGMSDFIGCLANKTQKVLTIEEINEATQKAWAKE